MPEWLSDGLVAALKAIIPTLAVGLVSTVFVNFWQHRYWSIRKRVEQQEQVLGQMRETLVRLSYFPEGYMKEPAALDMSRQENGGAGIAIAFELDANKLVNDRLELAGLATSVEQLFSAEADAAAGNAIDAIQKLIMAVLSTIRVDGMIPVDSSGVAARARAIMAVRSSLGMLANEVGNGAPWYKRLWWRLSQTAPRYGRREDDLLRQTARWADADTSKRDRLRRATDRAIEDALAMMDTTTSAASGKRDSREDEV